MSEAHSLVLFRDEIGEIPVEMQVKLLRALQESEFERVGGIKTIRVDVRLVAATNRDLKKLIAQGTFREDLFYRLNVVPIRLPALRERLADIPLLVEHFLIKFNERLRKNVAGAEPEALAALERHSWPGNIRELENVVERAVLFCDGPRLREQDLPEEVRTAERRASAPTFTPPPGAVGLASSQAASGFGGSASEGGSLPMASMFAGIAGDGGLGEGLSADSGLKEHVKVAMSRLERDIVSRALAQTNNNVTHAARLLKISRKGLQLKMKELGLREVAGERGDA
jgi:two-component system, NtrC family, response regulator AtoC